MVGAESRDRHQHHLLRWRGGWARLGPWRSDVNAAFLSVGAQRPPDAGVVERALRLAAADGYTAIVTNALPPGDALPFVDAGFTVRQRLHLLANDMSDLPPVRRPTRRANRADRTAVLAVDGQAFDDFWHLDDAGLDDALHATPTSRFRVAGDGGRVLAYAISGRAGSQGYLQRVAVHPEARRRGFGRSVVADGLDWLRRRGVDRTLVNTQSGNDAALDLYRSCGFSELPFGLCVLGRSL
ncbi:MAG: GNAT family N-acetyltransferase [Actinobacteria bacterium]|nr:GNAT family N-acetyltransferase [Actinomycetota bacterium]